MELQKTPKKQIGVCLRTSVILEYVQNVCAVILIQKVSIIKHRLIPPLKCFLENEKAVLKLSGSYHATV